MTTGDLKMSGYSHCDHCGNVTFTTSYGACYLCGEHKDESLTAHYIDPRRLQIQREQARQRKILAMAISLLAAAILTIFAIIFFLRM